MQTTSAYIQGSASELIAAGISIGSAKVDAVSLSIMAKHGIIKVVGKEEKVPGKRGKQGAIFEIPSSLLADSLAKV